MLCLKRKETVSDEDKCLENKRKLRRDGEKLRRERLNRTLGLLAEEVPWLKHSERRPDKSSILKLTVNYLKLNIGIKKRNLNAVLPSFLKDTVSEEFLESVAHGSLLIVSESGTILYMSESLTQRLGWLQIDVLGSPINKILHNEDIDLFKLQFNRHNNFCYTTKQCSETNKAYIAVNSARKVHRSFFVRMQNLQHVSENTPRFEEMRIVGHLHYHAQDRKKVRSVVNESWLVGSCHPVKQQSLISMQAYEDNTNLEWVSQHAMDGKLWYQDHRIALVVGVMPCEHVGMSVYDLVNKDDLKDIACSHMKIITDNEIPCTVFRLQSLNGLGPDKYIKARSVIVKDAWTRKNLFIVSLNQNISDEEGEVLLREQRKRVQTLIAATKGLTLQDTNFDEDSNTDASSSASDSSQPESPAFSELTSDVLSEPRYSIDCLSEGESLSGVSGSPPKGSPSNIKSPRKKESLPLLKSLLIRPNQVTESLDKILTVESKTQKDISMSNTEVAGQENEKGQLTVSDEVGGVLTDINDSIHVGNVERDTLSLNTTDVVCESVPGVKFAGVTSGGDKSVINKQYFISQISQFFPSVSSGGVLNADQKHCESSEKNAMYSSAQTGICSQVTNVGQGMLSMPDSEDHSSMEFKHKNVEDSSLKDYNKIQSPTISSQISPPMNTNCVQDPNKKSMELQFYKQLQHKHEALERSLQSQNQELTTLKRNLADQQPKVIEKLHLLQSEVEKQFSILHGLQNEMVEKMSSATPYADMT
ncbi:neuronal PAS domain-containing protein 2-like isoform X2 [Ostrea edulis]|uniref:neuronal PAS domain-containing protein 2-like isoform X2 n=1 Tax=Ostrea edulis TaxID=37623 RepID=UPI0020964AB0|nr:neuronal PAS domain-containing protein 2-like isoform X2 [Ostrea edulis]